MKGHGGMPPNGKSSTTLKQQYNGVMNNDPRPGSAQVKQTRPFVSQLISINLNHFSIYRLGEPAKAEREIMHENSDRAMVKAK